MNKTLQLAAVLGLSVSAFAFGVVPAVTTVHATSGPTEMALPGDGPIWNAAGNAMAQGEDITGHADGHSKPSGSK
jgi:hypothetical protein